MNTDDPDCVEDRHGSNGLSRLKTKRKGKNEKKNTKNTVDKPKQGQFFSIMVNT